MGYYSYHTYGYGIKTDDIKLDSVEKLQEFSVKLSLKKIGNKRLLLHFGAVDYKATVLVNGKKVGEHIGGYVPFFVDITDVVVEGKNTLTVLVEDDKLYDQPRGKQSYKKESFGCFYTRVLFSHSFIFRVAFVDIRALDLTDALYFFQRRICYVNYGKCVKGLDKIEKMRYNIKANRKTS